MDESEVDTSRARAEANRRHASLTGLLQRTSMSPAVEDWDDRWSVLVSGNNDGLHSFHKSDSHRAPRHDAC